jgi:signal transduction histidine kinase
MPLLDANSTLTQQLMALETVPDSYIVVSPQLLILTASNAYLADTLKRRNDLVGRYLFDAFPDNPAAPQANAVRNWRASLELVIATGKPHQMALQHYDVLDPERSGHFVERHWLPRNTPVFDAQGQLQYIIHSSVNVTEEVQARRAMEQAEGREQEALVEAERQRQRLSQLVLQAPAAICLFQGPDFVYELVNPGYQQLFGGRRHLLDKPLLEVTPEFRESPVWERLHEVYRTGQTHQDHEVPLSFMGAEGQNPEERYFNHTFQARYNEHQQVDGVYVFAFDVTEQVKARQQVLDLNQQLTRVNADLDSFVYMASHDLRGPINNLDGLVQALQEELPDPQAPTGPLLQMMQEAVQRFQRTLGQLGEVLQLHQAQDPAPIVELATIVEDLRQDLLPALQQTGGQLEVEADACPTVAMPAKSLRSLLYNLLSNALKYRHPDRPPHVRLTCRTQEGYWCLTVQDNGGPNGAPAGGVVCLVSPFSQPCRRLRFRAVHRQENRGEPRGPGRGAECTRGGFHLSSVCAEHKLLRYVVAYAINFMITNNLISMIASIRCILSRHAGCPRKARLSKLSVGLLDGLSNSIPSYRLELGLVSLGKLGAVRHKIKYIEDVQISQVMQSDTTFC